MKYNRTEIISAGTISVRIGNNDKSELLSICQNTDRSISYVVRFLLRKYIRNQKRKTTNVNITK